MRILIVLGALAACEHADESLSNRAPAPSPHEAAAPAKPTTPAKPPARPGSSAEPRPLVPPEPAPVEQPAPPIEPAPVAETELPPPPPQPHHPAPRERVPAADELPSPPSVNPKEYRAWLWDLPSDQRHQIALFCRANSLNFERACGGIGPFHVPRPPSLMPRPRGEGDREGMLGFTSREDWHTSLTAAQQSWVDSTCEAHYNEGELCTVMTPLVISLDDRPVEFTAGARFSFPGSPLATDWPTATTPWIALDLDGDGAITTGAELFGSYTSLPDGSAAPDGFAALAALDANGDGVIDAADPMFAHLVLWADADGDSRSTRDELTPLASRVLSISLAAHTDLRCDARRNCEGLRSTVHWRDPSGAEHTGSVVDVLLPLR